MTNSADPDQLASSEANWSGSTLFAKTGHVFSKRRVYMNWAASCENVSSGICGQRRPRSVCASAQSDQGIHCPLTEALATSECMNRERRPGWYFAHAQDNPNLRNLSILKDISCMTRPIQRGIFMSFHKKRELMTLSLTKVSFPGERSSPHKDHFMAAFDFVKPLQTQTSMY